MRGLSYLLSMCRPLQMPAPNATCAHDSECTLRRAYVCVVQQRRLHAGDDFSLGPSSVARKDCLVVAAA